MAEGLFHEKAFSQLNRKPLICNFVHKKAKVSRFAGGPDFPDYAVEEGIMWRSMEKWK